MPRTFWRPGHESFGWFLEYPDSGDRLAPALGRALNLHHAPIVPHVSYPRWDSNPQHLRSSESESDAFTSFDHEGMLLNASIEPSPTRDSNSELLVPQTSASAIGPAGGGDDPGTRTQSMRGLESRWSTNCLDRQVLDWNPSDRESGEPAWGLDSRLFTIPSPRSGCPAQPRGHPETCTLLLRVFNPVFRYQNLEAKCAARADWALRTIWDTLALHQPSSRPSCRESPDLVD